MPKSGSSVNIVTRLRPGRPGFKSRKGQWRDGLFYFSHPCVLTGTRAHAASYPVSTRGSFPGIKQPWREDDYSPPFIDEVKIAWSYTITSSYVFIAWCLIKQGMILNGVVLS